MTQRPEPCSHATTTTLLWLYGEADEAHAVHVATCAECTQVADEHASVVAAVSPIRDEIRYPGAAEVAVDTAEPAPANGSWWVGIGLGLVAAAAVLLALFAGLSPSAPTAPELAEAPLEAPVTVPDEAAPQMVPELDAPVREQVASQDDLDDFGGADDLDLYLALDDDLDDLFDEFAAFEADLATL